MCLYLNILVWAQGEKYSPCALYKLSLNIIVSQGVTGFSTLAFGRKTYFKKKSAYKHVCTGS